MRFNQTIKLLLGVMYCPLINIHKIRLSKRELQDVDRRANVFIKEQITGFVTMEFEIMHKA